VPTSLLERPLAALRERQAMAEGAYSPNTQGWFEMCLGASFASAGVDLRAPKPGPDFEVSKGSQRIFIEAVAPTPGNPEHADAVSEPVYHDAEGRAITIEVRVIGLRCASQAPCGRSSTSSIGTAARARVLARTTISKSRSDSPPPGSQTESPLRGSDAHRLDDVTTRFRDRSHGLKEKRFYFVSPGLGIIPLRLPTSLTPLPYIRWNN
jgi:hypothetical protein